MGSQLFLIWYFVLGFLLGNGVPHFVFGAAGKVFRSPFGQRVVLVNPSEVVEVMKVPRGKLITINEICRKIAQNHRVSGCCSLTTGIFIMIAANAAEEAKREGKDMDLQYWRTLKSNGFLNEKYPGGSMAQMEMLRKEGFHVERHGKKFAVGGFEKYFWTSF